MHRTGDDWFLLYRRSGAFWEHDGNPKRPHVLLTSSGKHAKDFFYSELVFENPVIVSDMCQDLVEALRSKRCEINLIDRVVGPAMGAVTLADNLARIISRDRGRVCFRSYTEREITEGRKTMLFRGSTARKNEIVLPVDDVLTSGENIRMSAESVYDAEAATLPHAAVIVNRSGLKEIDGRKIVSLIDLPMPSWDPDKCPLCKKGSEAVRPKSRQHWELLNANY